jgi:hypothetical protein
MSVAVAIAKYTCCDGKPIKTVATDYSELAHSFLTGAMLIP